MHLCSILMVAVSVLVVDTVEDKNSLSDSWPVASTTTKYPTGVVPSKIPYGTPYQVHGAEAQEFVSDALGYGGDEIDDSEKPWLVVFGPSGVTNQIRNGLPVDVSQKIHFAAYDPETDDGKIKLKELGVSVGGRGVKAIVMDAGGNVAYEGLFDKEEVLAKLRKLLGIKLPDDDDGSNWPIPNPFRRRPFWLKFEFWGGFAVGFLFGKFIYPLFRTLAALGPFLSDVKLVVEEVKKRRASSPK